MKQTFETNTRKLSLHILHADPAGDQYATEEHAYHPEWVRYEWHNNWLVDLEEKLDEDGTIGEAD